MSVATEPIIDKVWRERPDIPGWQKALGSIWWVIVIVQPAGWAYLAATFITNVVLGRQTPYQWATWVTATGAYLAVAAIALGIPVLLILLSQEPS